MSYKKIMLTGIIIIINILMVSVVSDKEKGLEDLPHRSVELNMNGLEDLPHKINNFEKQGLEDLLDKSF